MAIYFRPYKEKEQVITPEMQSVIDASLWNDYFINVQCTESKTGKIGSFITKGRSREAISPIFDGLYGLFPWMRENGWKSDEYLKDVYVPWRVSRKEENGHHSCSAQ